MSYTVQDRSTGTQYESVIDIAFNKTYSNRATIADVTFASRQEASGLNLEQEIEILDSSGNREFLGIVKNKPENFATNDTYTIKLEQAYSKLLDFDVNNRTFYQVDSGQVIDSLITEEVDQRGADLVYAGDQTADVTSDATYVELCNFKQIRPESYGTDMLFIGFDSSSSSNQYDTIIDNITYSGEIIQQIDIHMIANNLGDLFDYTIQYVDANNKNHVWTNDSFDGSGFLHLNLEDARDKEIQGGLDPSVDTEKILIRVELSGTPIEIRAIAIDAIITNSIDVNNRDHGFDAVNVPNSGRDLIRNFTETASEGIYNILQEENKKLIISEENTVEIVEEGEQSSELEIDDDTPVIDIDIDTNPDNIINKVIVEGQGDVYTKAEDRGSQSFYGFTKTRRVRDQSLVRGKEAREKADEILRKNAWTDTEITVKVPPLNSLQNTNVGDSIDFTRGSVNTTMIIKEITKSDNDLVKIRMETESTET